MNPLIRKTESTVPRHAEVINISLAGCKGRIYKLLVGFGLRKSDHATVMKVEKIRFSRDKCLKIHLATCSTFRLDQSV